MAIKLFIPGPTIVSEDILQELSLPMIGHRSKKASEIQKRISDNMQKVLFTENRILLSTSSGSGLMEGAIRSCTAKRAAVFSIGAFGDKWFKMAKTNGVPADKFSSVMGEPTTPEMVDQALATGKYDLVTVTHNETSSGIQNPVEEIAEVMKKYPDVVWCVDAVSSAAGSKIETDKLGIDILITSTQKALALPPGMAICSMSKKAYDRTAEVENRGLYFDLRTIWDFIDKKNYQYTSTPCLSLMYALDKQLQHIVNEEGIENRFARHQAMAEYTRAWANEHFRVYPNPKYLSKTLTVIDSHPKGKDWMVDVKELNAFLAERNMTLGNGYGDLKDKTFRIAHMGELTIDDLKEVTAAVEEYIKTK
ncbi:MAG: alanine--glyoxylate aminotransferase family protein [Akkermansia sp.]|nr:alanine--glyoxylate aminotransferase family protein [Akkermansia sp.]